jgi:hypothetical protein
VDEVRRDASSEIRQRVCPSRPLEPRPATSGAPSVTSYALEYVQNSGCIFDMLDDELEPRARHVGLWRACENAP